MHRQYLWISLKCTDNISTWAGSQVMRGYFTPVRPHHPWSRPNPNARDFFWGKNPRLAKKHHSMPLIGLISNSRNNVEFYEQLADWRPLFNWMLFFPLWTLIPWINPVQCHGLTKWQNGSRATCSGTLYPNAHQSLVSKPSVTWVSLRMADYNPLFNYWILLERSKKTTAESLHLSIYVCNQKLAKSAFNINLYNFG